MRKAFFIIALSLFTFSCSSDKNKESNTKEVSLQLGWIPSASYSGEIVASRKFDEPENLNLDIKTGGLGLNPITLVQTGQSEFGTAPADEILSAIEKGADFVIIGVINYNSPVGFISLKKNNIKTPKDFLNKRIGVLPFGSTNLVYNTLLNIEGIDKTLIDEITVSQDLKPFINGSHDVQPVFVYDETVTLDDNNIQYNVIEPKDFGVSFIGPCYFCTRKTYEQNPEVVWSFIKSILKGWEYTFKHKDDAIKQLKDFAPEISETRERQVLQKAEPYYTAYNGKLLDSDLPQWEKMIDELLKAKVLKSRPNLEIILKLDFVKNYYSINESKVSDQ
jgi:NitT/TauT family transport system substrate-binding protein